MADEERNYWSLVLLLVRVGNSTVRLYFKNQWDALGVFRKWTDKPHNGADLLRKFKPLPYEKSKVQSGDTSTWDLSLLVKALLKSAPSFVSDKDLIGALECLRDMRNEVCHSPTPKVKAAEFQKKWQNACNALTLFGATSDDFDRVTLDVRREDLNLLIQQCASHEKEILDVLKTVTSGIQNVQLGQETIAQAQKDQHLQVTGEIRELIKGQENLLQGQKQVRDEVKKISSQVDDKQGGNIINITTTNIEAKDNANIAVGDNASWTNQYGSIPLPSSGQLVDVKVASTNLKSSVIRRTEQKQVGSPVLVNAKTDDIFTSLLFYKERKALQKHHPNTLEGPAGLEGHCKMSSTAVDHIEEIFIGTEKNPKLIQITGKPGIGKTFFCEKLVRDWAKNQLFSSPARSTVDGFQFAYLLKFRDLNSLENELNLRELLNLSSLLDEKSIVDDNLMKYLIENPDKLLIILDGYDEYKYEQNIANNYEKQYPNDPLERMPAQALLSKLINKRILNNSVIIMSSRPGEADKLGENHFDEYVQIHGFSPQQVTEFVEKYFTANERMKNKVVEFVKTNVIITNFCHIPMMSFLMCGYLE